MKKVLTLIFSILFLASLTSAQQAEVTIQLNEPFFDLLLDAIFKNAAPPSFPIAVSSPKSKFQSPKSENEVEFIKAFAENQSPKPKVQSPNKEVCDESIKLQREVDGVRTAVRFRDGKIYAPIAFLGNYNPPFIGCVEFTGWAETNIELSFDREKQALIGRAQVTNVQLSGTRGVGSSFITKLVQSSIDKRMNPIQILPLEKVSFTVPVQNAGNIKMRAVDMRPEIANNLLNVHITYEFTN